MSREGERERESTKITHEMIENQYMVVMDHGLGGGGRRSHFMRLAVVV